MLAFILFSVLKLHLNKKEKEKNGIRAEIAVMKQ